VIPSDDKASLGPAEIKELRRRAGCTQAQAAQLLDVTERTVQLWESGRRPMPTIAWRLMRLKCGYRYPTDFQIANSAPKSASGTFHSGDFVRLQPLDGPLIEARVWQDLGQDGLVDVDSHGALVIGFPDRPDAGQEFGGFYVGERITFSASNVVHYERRGPVS
jgi:DNA-binding XRE family transcriptional regulator